MRFPRPLPLLAALALTACSTKSPATAGAPSSDAGSDGGLLAARPYTIVVPTGYDATKPTPLVFMMHGYGFDGTYEEGYMQLTPVANAHGFLYAYADGTLDKHGSRFWNATDACCNLDSLPVDDVGYIDVVLADIESKYNVDKKRVFLVGHSNGAFMAHRYACDRAGSIAAIVSLAGAQWEDPTKCQPSEPVAVAQVHGTADNEIFYDGGVTIDRDGTQHPYPSASQTVATWAAKDTCAPGLADGGWLDLETTLPGAETNIQRYSGCAATSGVELWTIQGGSHIPYLAQPTWGETVWAFLSAHAKP